MQFKLSIDELELLIKLLEAAVELDYEYVRRYKSRGKGEYDSIASNVSIVAKEMLAHRLNRFRDQL